MNQQPSSCRQHALETLGSQVAAAAQPQAKRRKPASATAADSGGAEAAAAAEALTDTSDAAVAKVVAAAAAEQAQSPPQPDTAAVPAGQDTSRQKRSVHWAQDDGYDDGRLHQVRAFAQAKHETLSLQQLIVSWRKQRSPGQHLCLGLTPTGREGVVKYPGRGRFYHCSHRTCPGTSDVSDRAALADARIKGIWY